MKNYILILLTLFMFTVLNAQSYKVIVNSSNTTSSVSKKDISNIFLKKKSKWDSGVKIVVVDQTSKSSIRRDFSKAVLNKSVGAVKSYWQQYVFAGKGTPPIEKKSDAEVIAFVKSHSGGVGYVSGNAAVSGVKVVSVKGTSII